MGGGGSSELLHVFHLLYGEKKTHINLAQRSQGMCYDSIFHGQGKAERFQIWWFLSGDVEMKQYGGEKNNNNNSNDNK